MHFCDECGMLYFIHVSDKKDDAQLIYYCRKCGHKKNIVTEDNMCVSKTHITRKVQKINNIINEYTKYDPTLPRIKNISCPNSACDSNKKEDAKEIEIIYLRYDDINIKYIYLCVHCDKVWKLDNI